MEEDDDSGDFYENDDDEDDDDDDVDEADKYTKKLQNLRKRFEQVSGLTPTIQEREEDEDEAIRKSAMQQKPLINHPINQSNQPK